MAKRLCFRAKRLGMSITSGRLRQRIVETESSRLQDVEAFVLSGDDSN
jgi:hypothetical protein